MLQAHDKYDPDVRYEPVMSDCLQNTDQSIFGHFV